MPGLLHRCYLLQLVARLVAINDDKDLKSINPGNFNVGLNLLQDKEDR